MNNKYRESPFNINVKNEKGMILFNTFTGQMVQFSGRFQKNKEYTIPQKKIMVNGGFWVPTDLSIFNDYQNVFQKIQNPSECLYVVLTITTKCDLQCIYCFENRQKRYSMSFETLTKSLNWIEKKLNSGNFTSFYLIIFGGEPLLEQLYVEKLLIETGKLCKKNKIHRHPVLLTTNGLIGNKVSFNNLKKCGLDSLQISFDGNRDFTNKNRKSKENEIKDVYSETLKILPLLSSQFNITIKLNFSPQNIHSIPEFFDDILSLNNFNIEKIKIKPETIMIYQRKQEQSEITNIFNPGDIDLAKAYSYICEEANFRDLKLDTSAFFNTPCMAFTGSSFLIEPDGNVKSCICAFGMNEFKVDNVLSEDSKISHLYLNDEINSFKRCIKNKCQFFPLCLGGCPYEHLLITGSFDNILCRKKYFEAIIPIYIKQQWKNSSHKVFFY